MLNRAAQRAVAAQRAAPTQALLATERLSDQRFDAVVSQLGLMFSSDRRQALREMQRVLKRGGRLAVAVWASLDSAPAYAAEVKLVERVAGKRAADGLRAPFALGDPKELAQLVAGAGVAEATISTQPGVARFPGIRSMIEVVLAEDQIQLILRDAELVLGAYVTGAGTMAFELAAHLVTGTKSRHVAYGSGPVEHHARREAVEPRPGEQGRRGPNRTRSVP